MIEANELRIGNLFKDSKTGELLWVSELKQDYGVFDFVIIYHVINRDKYPLPDGWQAEPIPLTPEILEKCGFVGKTKDGKDFKLHDLMRMMKDNEGNIILFHSYFMNEAILRDINLKCSVIKYVHQYQNLYFALCGQELQISL